MEEEILSRGFVNSVVRVGDTLSIWTLDILRAIRQSARQSNRIEWTA